MDATPRLRSAYPPTPSSSTFSRSRPRQAPPGTTASPRIPDIKSLSTEEKPSEGPLVSFETIDAPSQRLYAAAVYLLLLLWKLYDFFRLFQDEDESFWLFLKWIAIDGTFLFGLPSLRIPWLEWSPTTMTILFMLHSVFNAILMFRIPIPLSSALVAMTKALYDTELAISERHVKPASLLQDSSHILGKYEIHVLPEGSALLNPSSIPLCLEATRSSTALLPLQLNQTQPSSIELIRYDLATLQNETIRISSSQVRKMAKNGKRLESGAILLEHPVSKSGLYRLGKVVDQSNLEVAHPVSETLVVQCPKARIKSAGPNRCRGELSNIALQVDGTPPLKIKYRKTVNGEDRDITYQSIQPDDYVSPLVRQPDSGTLISSSHPDLSWATSSTVNVPLNETLSRSGIWSYSVDEVSDAFGNVVLYRDSDPDYEQSRPRSQGLDDSFTVHERPFAMLNGDFTRSPIRAAIGESVEFPLQFQSNLNAAPDTNFHISYKFTPSEELTDAGEHGVNPQMGSFKTKAGQSYSRSEPGLYTLASVKSDHCDGEIEEPSSFSIMNPPKPNLDLTTQRLVDKCADRQIGLRVEFNMTGTPGYAVQYSSQRKGGGLQKRVARFDGPRGQVDLSPDEAGHWTYKILALKDALYTVDLRSRNLVIEQDVRPSAFAYFPDTSSTRAVCIDESVAFEVRFQGEGPWALEYELVHGKQRTKHVESDISQELYTITTGRLSKGGEYSLALMAVKDGQGCRETLQQDAQIHVRHQRPHAAFGQIEKKRSVRTLEARPVELPLRLAGEGPWTVEYQRIDSDSSAEPVPGPKASKLLRNANDGLTVVEPGTYQLTDIKDALCPGIVDEKANTFDVQHIPRPQIVVPPNSFVESKGHRHIRSEVCEGQDDAMEIGFVGRPPYDVKYVEKIKPEHKSHVVRPLTEMTVPVNSAQIKMDTTQAGFYEYSFAELSDYNYEHSKEKHTPVVIEQTVYARPAVQFVNQGKVHSFCQDSFQDPSQASESIPVKLQGQAPFSVDIEIRHQASSQAIKPKQITITNIPSTSHSLQIPHSALQSGSSNVIIRRVKDARGCERFYDAPSSIPSHQKASRAAGNEAPCVQVAVHAAPSLEPAEPHRRAYCVGERLGFSLTGTPPFNIEYTFAGSKKKAAVSGSMFRRIAESPGNFTITSVSDATSGCTAKVHGVARQIHDLPRVKVSKGKTAVYDIHAGGSVDVTFEFQGSPPFHFTYTRSEAVKQKGASGGYRQGRVLDTRTLSSNERTKSIAESEEGIYEVVAIRDRYCSFAKSGYEGIVSGSGVEGGGRVLDGPNLGDERLLEL